MATLSSASACSQLTHLSLGGRISQSAISAVEADRLFQTHGMAQLQDVSFGVCHVRPEQLRAWIGQHTSLTRLFLWSNESVAAVTESLPTSLRELHLPSSSSGELPACLLHLRNLTGLDASHWGLCQLPSWLSELRRLQWISLSPQVTTPQAVLGQLPLLQQVLLPLQAPPARAVVLAHVPHLCWAPTWLSDSRRRLYS